MGRPEVFFALVDAGVIPAGLEVERGVDGEGVSRYLNFKVP